LHDHDGGANADGIHQRPDDRADVRTTRVNGSSRDFSRISVTVTDGVVYLTGRWLPANAPHAPCGSPVRCPASAGS
jgi:hypothetical protein